MPRLPGAEEEHDLEPRLVLARGGHVLDRAGAKPGSACGAAALVERLDEVVDEVGPLEVDGQRRHGADLGRPGEQQRGERARGEEGPERQLPLERRPAVPREQREACEGDQAEADQERGQH